MKFTFLSILAIALMYGQKIDFKNHPYGSLGKDNLLSANTSIGDIDNDGDVDIAVANGRHWSQFQRALPHSVRP